MFGRGRSLERTVRGYRQGGSGGLRLNDAYIYVCMRIRVYTLQRVGECNSVLYVVCMVVRASLRIYQGEVPFTSIT